MLIILGRSASGKTEIVKKLIAKYNMQKLITYTSRKIRLNEINGIDYYFLTKQQFERKIKDGFFLEYVKYNENYYGTSFESLSSDKVVILEPNGLKNYLSKVNDLKVVYLTCDEDIIYERMITRGDDIEIINKRMVLDRQVFSNDLCALADLVVNTNYNTVDEITDLIYDFYKPFRQGYEN